MPTIKQKKAILNLVGNGGNVTKAMRDANYSENTLNTPQKLTESVGGRELLNPIIEKMEKERDRLIQALSKKKLSKEKYRDMMEGIDKLTKNIQLLNGGATERQGLNITFDNAFIQDETT